MPALHGSWSVNPLGFHSSFPLFFFVRISHDLLLSPPFLTIPPLPPLFWNWGCVILYSPGMFPNCSVMFGVLLVSARSSTFCARRVGLVSPWRSVWRQVMALTLTRMVRPSKTPSHPTLRQRGCPQRVRDFTPPAPRMPTTRLCDLVFLTHVRHRRVLHLSRVCSGGSWSCHHEKTTSNGRALRL